MGQPSMAAPFVFSGSFSRFGESERVGHHREEGAARGGIDGELRVLPLVQRHHVREQIFASPDRMHEKLKSVPDLDAPSGYPEHSRSQPRDDSKSVLVPKVVAVHHLIFPPGVHDDEPNRLAARVDTGRSRRTLPAGKGDSCHQNCLRPCTLLHRPPPTGVHYGATGATGGGDEDREQTLAGAAILSRPHLLYRAVQHTTAALRVPEQFLYITPVVLSASSPPVPRPSPERARRTRPEIDRQTPRLSRTATRAETSVRRRWR